MNRWLLLAAIAGDIVIGAPLKTAGRLLNGALTQAGAHQRAGVYSGAEFEGVVLKAVRKHQRERRL